MSSGWTCKRRDLVVMGGGVEGEEGGVCGWKQVVVMVDEGERGNEKGHEKLRWKEEDVRRNGGSG